MQNRFGLARPSSASGDIRSNTPRPTTIAIFFIAVLIAATFICLRIIGRQSVLAYASKQRSYSAILSKESHHEFLNASNRPKIICFGDSNLFYPPEVFISSADNFPMHIPGLIQEAMKESGVQPEPVFLELAFAGASMFDYYCLFHYTKDLSPDLIIVPINWRVFGDDWLENLDLFHPELSGLVPFAERLPAGYRSPIRSRNISRIRQLEFKAYLYYIYIIGIKVYIRDSLPLFLNANSRHGESIAVAAVEALQDQTGMANVETQHGFRAAKQLLGFKTKPPLARNFPMEIREDHPTFQNLRALVCAASGRGVKVLFYIWPIDQKRLEKAGVLDKSSLEVSKKLIDEATQAQDIYLVDLSDLLEHQYFFDEKGHVKVSGRRIIAKALGTKVISILEEDRVAAKQH